MCDYRNVPEGVDPEVFINDKLDWAAAEDNYQYRLEKWDRINRARRQELEARKQAQEEKDRQRDFMTCAKLLKRAYDVLIADDEFRGMLFGTNRHTRSYAKKLIYPDLWDRLVQFRNRLCGSY